MPTTAWSSARSTSRARPARAACRMESAPAAHGAARRTRQSERRSGQRARCASSWRPSRSSSTSSRRLGASAPTARMSDAAPPGRVLSGRPSAELLDGDVLDAVVARIGHASRVDPNGPPASSTASARAEPGVGPGARRPVRGEPFPASSTFDVVPRPSLSDRSTTGTAGLDPPRHHRARAPTWPTRAAGAPAGRHRGQLERRERRRVLGWPGHRRARCSAVGPIRSCGSLDPARVAGTRTDVDLSRRQCCPLRRRPTASWRPRAGDGGATWSSMAHVDDARRRLRRTAWS